MEKTRLAVLVGCACLAACSGNTVSTATYATMTEARAAGAVEKGLLPSLLPADAYELRVAYDGESHRRWGLFNFRPVDEPALRQALSPQEASIGGMELEIPARVEWWPVQLRGRLDEERILATGLRAHQSRHGGFTFLVNWKQGRAYYWRQ
jgi:hypothetical protein